MLLRNRIRVISEEKHRKLHFAGFKKHAGLYPGPEAVQEFSGRLKEYKASKGTIRRIGGMYFMGNEKIYQMDFSKVYHLLVSKAEKKGRTRQEVDEAIRWLTGYSQPELEGMLEKPVAYRDFFRDAPELNENRKLIKGGGLRHKGGRYRRASDAGDTLSG